MTLMISIIIPVYNCEKYIEKCIKSVCDQSYKEFELLIVNDGSTDNTPNICEALAAEDSRIKVFNTPNGGVSKARNFGIDKARGELITFIDGDDTVPSNYLSELYNAVQSADVSVCDIVCIRDGNEVSRFSCNENSIDKSEAIKLLLSRRAINSGPCGKLFKRQIVGDIRFPAMKTYEDILFVLEVFDKAQTVNCTDKTAYVYDVGTGGAMSGYAKHPTTDVVTMAEKVLEYIDKHTNELGFEPEYVTLSHVMQHLQGICENTTLTEEQIVLKNAIIKHFYVNRKRIRNNPCFKFKEKLVYLFAARGRWLKKGFKKI